MVLQDLENSVDILNTVKTLVRFVSKRPCSTPLVADADFVSLALSLITQFVTFMSAGVYWFLNCVCMQLLFYKFTLRYVLNQKNLSACHYVQQNN